MKDKIEVGEYVRTKNGEIGKVLIFYGKDDCYKKMNNYSVDYIDGAVYEEDIIKHSKNIIDLIEVGDFVNGNKVVGKDKTSIVLLTDEGQTFLRSIFEEKYIKSIVTKEQFKDIEYKLED